MDELRRNHIARIKLSTDKYIEGEVIDYSSDRVKILIFPYSIDDAKSLKELDSVHVFVHTHMGIKEMVSNVIDELDSVNCVTVENNPTVAVVQRRAFVRVISDLKFKIAKGDKIYDCVCDNISAGGIAFRVQHSDLNVGDIVSISFFKEYFEKDIFTKAEIIKQKDNWFVAKYIGLYPRDEDRIVKYVFKTIVKHYV